MTLAKMIAAARKKKGWDQKTLSTESGVSQSTICRIESGATRYPYFTCVVALSVALDLSLDKLASAKRP